MSAPPSLPLLLPSSCLSPRRSHTAHQHPHTQACTCTRHTISPSHELAHTHTHTISPSHHITSHTPSVHHTNLHTHTHTHTTCTHAHTHPPLARSSTTVAVRCAVRRFSVWGESKSPITQGKRRLEEEGRHPSPGRCRGCLPRAFHCGTEFKDRS